MGKNSGYLVETKSGKRGRTYHRDKKVNKKTVVYIDDEKIPMLCDPKTLKIIGYAE